MAASYRIGYGKPPKHTQFKKGCSGNPSGRPKGSKSVIALQEKILNEKVVVTENGRRMKISKTEVLFRQLWKMAVTGDIRAMRLLLEFVWAAGERTELRGKGGGPIETKNRDRDEAADIQRFIEEAIADEQRIAAAAAAARAAAPPADDKK